MAEAPAATAELEIPQAELLLMATGLLKSPTKVHLRATRTFQRDLTKALKAALALEDPARLYALKWEGAAYWKRLQATVHDYEALGGVWEDLLGLELSAGYQGAQLAARAEIEARHPSTTISTVRGDLIVPSDALSEGLFAILVDTVEDHMRLVHDFAAGVLISAQVQVYATCYPEAYSYLGQILETELSRLGAVNDTAEEQWVPPMWLSDQIKVMRQQPLETTVDTDAAKSTPSPTTKKLDLKDQLRDMETGAERAAVT